MEPITHLYELLEKSDISMIGYTYKNENLKDQIISKIPHISVGEVDIDSFSIKQYLRDIKINQILEDSEPYKWLVLDIGQMGYPSNKNGMEFSKALSSLIDKIRSELYRAWNEHQKTSMGLDFDDPESHKQEEEKFKTPFKLLITTPMYKSSSELEINNFTGGHSSIYTSDLVFVIQDSSISEKFLGKKPRIKIVKNRFDQDNINISFDELENYNYICDYEYSK